VDDEVNGRRQLRGLISLDPECELVGECANGAEAMRSLEETEADILFVDAETPDINGFEVARAMCGRAPLVILTSGRSDYAVQAFEAQAFDYLLKPIERSRFRNSIGRAKTEVARRNGLNLMRQRQPPERIAVRQNGRVLFLRLHEIDWIEAADNYVGLHCGARTHMLRETMSEAEARLDPARFVRIHRSTIVNIDRIRELRPRFRGDYQVILEDGTQLTLTKAHRERLDSQLLLGSFTR
jgi:two-component system LytT family response regulator